jgi:hypothetical protein
MSLKTFVVSCFIHIDLSALYQIIAMAFCQKLFQLFVISLNEMLLIFLLVPISFFLYFLHILGSGVQTFYAFIPSQSLNY